MKLNTGAWERLARYTEEIADEKSNGEVTIVRSAAGWRVHIGPPHQNIGTEIEHDANPRFLPTLDLALLFFVAGN